ncbi:hypothetical protein B0J17DRAFT_717196 [Rhizoctonia solani]|nr:hypothetical protein B0J17DRAFT_717196 [Rhizoctonia solani]
MGRSSESSYSSPRWTEVQTQTPSSNDISPPENYGPVGYSSSHSPQCSKAAARIGRLAYNLPKPDSIGPIQFHHDSSYQPRHLRACVAQLPTGQEDRGHTVCGPKSEHYTPTNHVNTIFSHPPVEQVARETSGVDQTGSWALLKSLRRKNLEMPDSPATRQTCQLPVVDPEPNTSSPSLSNESPYPGSASSSPNDSYPEHQEIEIVDSLLPGLEDLALTQVDGNSSETELSLYSPPSGYLDESVIDHKAQPRLGGLSFAYVDWDSDSRMQFEDFERPGEPMPGPLEESNMELDDMANDILEDIDAITTPNAACRAMFISASSLRYFTLVLDFEILLQVVQVIH